jgi:hypothetical protein
LQAAAQRGDICESGTSCTIIMMGVHTGRSREMEIASQLAFCNDSIEHSGFGEFYYRKSVQSGMTKMKEIEL